MTWTSLNICDWRDMLPLMKRLGLSGGFDYHSHLAEDSEAQDASLLSINGNLMIRTAPFVEEWSPEGLIGVHLLWDHKKNSFEELEEMVSVDSIAYSRFTEEPRLRVEKRFVLGQQRKVFISCPGSSNDAFWSALYLIADKLEDSCKLHYMSTMYANEIGFQFSKIFSGIFDSATIKTPSDVIVAPNGMNVNVNDAYEKDGLEDWLELVGFDLEMVTLDGVLGKKNRKALSVCSALWASRNWNSMNPTLRKDPNSDVWSETVLSAGARPDLLVDYDPDAMKRVRKNGSFASAKISDMISCNSCSLFYGCEFARTGSICAIPESDMGELSEFFKTRDTTKIIDGLGELLGLQADRVETAMAAEDTTTGVHDDVTKMIHGLFDRGVKLAKLTDPRLNGGPKVSVSLTNNSIGAISSGSPQQLAAGLVAELESRGVDRADITPELIAKELGIGDDTVEDAVVVSMDDTLGVLPEQA